MHLTKKAIVAAVLALNALMAHAIPVTWGVNGHQYGVVASEGITWTDARAATLALGGNWDLATITSAAEESFVTSLLSANPPSRSHFWLGASDTAVEGSYVWVTGESFSYTNWWSAEPNNVGNEDFLAYCVFC